MGRFRKYPAAEVHRDLLICPEEEVGCRLSGFRFQLYPAAMVHQRPSHVPRGGGFQRFAFGLRYTLQLWRICDQFMRPEEEVIWNLTARLAALAHWVS